MYLIPGGDEFEDFRKYNFHSQHINQFLPMRTTIPNKMHTFKDALKTPTPQFNRHKLYFPQRNNLLHTPVKKSHKLPIHSRRLPSSTKTKFLINNRKPFPKASINHTPLRMNDP